MRSVSAGLRAKGYDYRASVRDAFNLALKDAKLRRVDEIVRGVHRYERCANGAERRTGVIVARRLHGVEHIVRIRGFSKVDYEIIERRIRLRARRRRRLAQYRIAAHEPEHLGGGVQAWGLNGIIGAAPLGSTGDRVHDQRPTAEI